MVNKKNKIKRVAMNLPIAILMTLLPIAKAMTNKMKVKPAKRSQMTKRMKVKPPKRSLMTKRMLINPVKRSLTTKSDEQNYLLWMLVECLLMIFVHSFASGQLTILNI